MGAAQGVNGPGQIELEYRRERQAAGNAVAKDRGIYRGRQRGTAMVPPRRAQELRSRGLTVQEIATALSRFALSAFVFGSWTAACRRASGASRFAVSTVSRFQPLFVVRGRLGRGSRCRRLFVVLGRLRVRRASGLRAGSKKPSLSPRSPLDLSQPWMSSSAPQMPHRLTRSHRCRARAVASMASMASMGTQTDERRGCLRSPYDASSRQDR